MFFFSLELIDLYTVKVGICDFPLSTRQSISSGGSTAPYLIRQLSVRDQTERRREGTEGRENVDGQASTSGLSRQTDRGVITKHYTKANSTLSS